MRTATIVLAALLATNFVHADPLVPPAPEYAPAVERIERVVKYELESKRLPAVSVALVDDQTVVWAKGFGFADPAAKVPATADTVYRVGSVSKLFTDLAVMQLVEAGKLDLDAPVTKYLPDFKPQGTGTEKITLRHLMSHRAGLIREPPVGNYFDPVNLSLEKMVESLNTTALVYPPETKIKYSNAGIAVVGYTLQQTQQQPFAPYLKKAVLDPLGMTHSGFEPTPELKKDLAHAIMWTVGGREFAAPTFELGMAPAGCMYSTVNDLAKFMSALAAGGKPVVKQSSLDEMWKPQFAKPDEKTGIGLGFFVNERDGRRRIGHNGAIYGFATELAYLPEAKFGVVVAISCDCANPVAGFIADYALDCMVAARDKKPLPEFTPPTAVDPALARRLAGRWQSDDKKVTHDLFERDGHLWLLPGRGGMRVELKQSGSDLVPDDRLGVSGKIVVGNETGPDTLTINKVALKRVAVPKPEPIPERWAGLIGEYGEDHNILVILERDAKLFALIEWFFLYPLTEESENVLKFPDWGLYHDEKLVFTRDKSGRAEKVIAASVEFRRRPQADGTFKIKPIRQLDGLRREAMAAEPPPEPGDFLKPDLVELAPLDESLKLDVRYATDNNFLSTPFYPVAKAFLQRPAAEALIRVHRKLAADGLGLLIHDGYRPWHVTKMFWEATPEPLRVFVADPMKGSRHNRGCAVDLSMHDRTSGRPVQMTGGYDEMTDRSYPDYLGGTSLQRWYRDTLRRAMEAEGFSVYEAEWWHFDYKDWRRYPILNIPLDKVNGRR